MAFTDWLGEAFRESKVSSGGVQLDAVTLANARASLGDAELLTAQGYHAEALLFAREALRKLQLVLAQHDREVLARASREGAAAE